MIEIPENKDGCPLTEEERVDIVAQVFLRGGKVMTSFNKYGGGKIKRVTWHDPETNRDKVWYDTELMAGCQDSRYKEEPLFLPCFKEVDIALGMFKDKGWHAYYDDECLYYKVCKERHARGEYADRHTNWLF